MARNVLVLAVLKEGKGVVSYTSHKSKTNPECILCTDFMFMNIFTIIILTKIHPVQGLRDTQDRAT